MYLFDFLYASRTIFFSYVINPYLHIFLFLSVLFFLRSCCYTPILYIPLFFIIYYFLKTPVLAAAPDNLYLFLFLLLSNLSTGFFQILYGTIICSLILRIPCFDFNGSQPLSYLLFTNIFLFLINAYLPVLAAAPDM